MLEGGVIKSRFRLRNKIGSGSFGEIYAGTAQFIHVVADDLESSRRVAVKLVLFSP